MANEKEKILLLVALFHLNERTVWKEKIGFCTPFADVLDNTHLFLMAYMNLTHGDDKTNNCNDEKEDQHKYKQ